MTRPTPATAIATIALFVALGGTSYGVATGSIDSREIKNNSIRGKDVRNGSLGRRDFAAGQLPAGPRGATGATGAPGSARAYGEVRVKSNGEYELVLGNSRNVLSLTQLSNSSVACIQPARGIDPRRAIVIATPIFHKGAGSASDTTALVARPNIYCAADRIEISPYSSTASVERQPFFFAVM